MGLVLASCLKSRPSSAYFVHYLLCNSSPFYALWRLPIDRCRLPSPTESNHHCYFQILQESLSRSILLMIGLKKLRQVGINCILSLFCIVLLKTSCINPNTKIYSSNTIRCADKMKRFLLFLILCWLNIVLGAENFYTVYLRISAKKPAVFCHL